MALDWFQNFVSTQYLENKWMEFYQIFFMHLYRQVIGLDGYTAWKALQVGYSEILWQY